MLHFCEYINPLKDPKPFDYDKIGVFYPPHVAPRIAGQSGLFTIQPNPDEELRIVKDKRFPDDIIKLEFDASVAASIQEMLFRIGVKEEMLFPDLDGYSRGIKIHTELAGLHYREC